jgi:hypothetical protein
MLRLPNQIAVQLVDPRGNDLREANVLIGLNLLHADRYYYGNLVGLTDSTGRTSITGKEIERRYASDQRNFPMDYKLELIECDAVGEVLLVSEEDIRGALDGLESFGDSAAYRRMYETARNGQFAPAALKCLLDAEGEGDVLVRVTTSRHS